MGFPHLFGCFPGFPGFPLGSGPRGPPGLPGFPRLRASPLHLAAKEGHAAVVDLLLEQRADAQNARWGRKSNVDVD